jgi:hypothetical protein
MCVIGYSIRLLWSSTLLAGVMQIATVHHSHGHRLLHSSEYPNALAVEHQAVLHLFSLEIIPCHLDCEEFLCMESGFIIIIIIIIIINVIIVIIIVATVIIISSSFQPH